MKCIYIIEVFECGRWCGYYACGYFTTLKKATIFLDKMCESLEPSKRELYKVQKIYKNNYN